MSYLIARPAPPQHIMDQEAMLQKNNLLKGSCTVEKRTFIQKMVPPTRIERAARGLGNRCSIRLSYGGIQYFHHAIDFMRNEKGEEA